MDNKKLFKFLYKDIAEIEELFNEKGKEAFDELEIEFIRTRFSGAKRIIQLFSGRDENTNADSVIDERIATPSATNGGIKKDQLAAPPSELKPEEKESLKDLEEFEEEIKDDDTNQEDVKEADLNAESVPPEHPRNEKESVEASAPVRSTDNAEEIKERPVERKATDEERRESDPANKTTEVNGKQEVEINDHDDSLTASTENNPAINRIGDRMIKERSVNDLLLGKDNLNLEYKISNSPVKSIQTAIGINDRYQYIRELFDGSADTFTKTVRELDNLNDIKEAVSYLQENFKWKKNETSLKFVNLVKRRFANG